MQNRYIHNGKIKYSRFKVYYIKLKKQKCIHNNYIKMENISRDYRVGSQVKKEKLFQINKNQCIFPLNYTHMMYSN